MKTIILIFVLLFTIGCVKQPKLKNNQCIIEHVNYPNWICDKNLFSNVYIFSLGDSFDKFSILRLSSAKEIALKKFRKKIDKYINVKNKTSHYLLVNDISNMATKKEYCNKSECLVGLFLKKEKIDFLVKKYIGEINE